MQPTLATDGCSKIVSSTNEDQPTQVKFKTQDTVLVNSLKILDGSNKPHVLIQSIALRQRYFMYIKAVKKRAKTD